MPESPTSGQAIVCTACGARLKPDANFCTTCGAAVGAAPGVSPQAASTRPAATGQSRQRRPWPWVIVAGIVVAVGLLAVVALTRPQPATTVPAAGQPAAIAPQQDLPYPDVPRISPVDAKAQLDSGQAVIVDVRGDAYYQAAHVDGAVSIPLTQIEKGQHDLPKDAEIILYCT